MWLTSVACGLVGALATLGLMVGTPARATSVQVAPGQTLGEIAATYGTTVSALAAANGMVNPNLVLAGATLLIPSGSDAPTVATTHPTTIVVAPGDSLSSIAVRYGTTVAALVQLNGIRDPDYVEAGSQFVVDASTPVTGAASPTTTTSSTSTGGGLPAQVLAYPDRAQLQPVFHQWAGAFGVPVNLLEAMCWWESGWRADVVSSTGAVGICQLEPQTVSILRIRIGDPTLDATVPADNIEMSAALLHDLLVETGGSESLALASYYQGFASVSQNGMFASTVQYVQGIMSSMAGFS